MIPFLKIEMKEDLSENLILPISILPIENNVKKILRSMNKFR